MKAFLQSLKELINGIMQCLKSFSDDVNVTVEFEDGKRKSMTAHTVDGKWNTGLRLTEFKVIAWQPLPAPYKEGDKA